MNVLHPDYYTFLDLQFINRTLASNSYYKSSVGWELSSGGRSHILIDASTTFRRWEVQRPLANIMAYHLGSIKAVGVGGPGTGADPMAAALCNNTVGLYWFSVRKDFKRRGLDKGTITGPVKKGDKVIVVEDVVTTGANAIRAIHSCIDIGLQPVIFIAGVDREEGGMEKIQNNFPELKIPFRALTTKSAIERYL